ncbi:hypothetical protein [Oceanirhabdus sp. W0125-5]|uniref:hypothetical protein n=1 Tax=Oceanirhabdus sp. W0125-5 TaxID=2999116 RepID=UPI0022F2AA7D|nr:hypothetical protein [Oceanirhabdus sp. W0125-5]WBW96145.1 hypothetical protein OW730_21000 [Oceanirhabdus sp. W0125-5]
MKVIRKVFVSMAVFMFLINSINSSCFANNGENYESEYNKITISDGMYTIVFSDSEYYVFDEHEMLVENNEANYIHSIFESNGEVYLINIIYECEEYRWQLFKLNIGTDKGFEIIEDKAYEIFNTETNGIVVVNNIGDNIFEFKYSNETGEDKSIKLSLDGFNDYGSLRNVKEIDIREYSILFLTLAGEAIEYNFIFEKFNKITDDFVWSLGEV